MITKDNVRELLRKKDLIQLNYVYESPKKKYWKLLKPLTIELRDGKIISIPKGFVWDLASVPKTFWGMFPPFGNFLLATLIHDYLYIVRVDGYDRAKSDKEMLYWSNILNKSKIDNNIRYIFVRAFGWLWWKKIV